MTSFLETDPPDGARLGTLRTSGNLGITPSG
jgi:hypothetical protein